MKIIWFVLIWFVYISSGKWLFKGKENCNCNGNKTVMGRNFGVIEFLNFGIWKYPKPGLWNPKLGTWKLVQFAFFKGKEFVTVISRLKLDSLSANIIILTQRRYRFIVFIKWQTDFSLPNLIEVLLNRLYIILLYFWNI